MAKAKSKAKGKASNSKATPDALYTMRVKGQAREYIVFAEQIDNADAKPFTAPNGREAIEVQTWAKVYGYEYALHSMVEVEGAPNVFACEFSKHRTGELPADARRRRISDYASVSESATARYHDKVTK